MVLYGPHASWYHFPVSPAQKAAELGRLVEHLDRAVLGHEIAAVWWGFRDILGSLDQYRDIDQVASDVRWLLDAQKERLCDGPDGSRR